MKRIKSFNKFNEGVLGTLAAGGAAIGALALAAPGSAERLGKLIGNIHKGIKHLKTLIGRTGNDEDLAEQILDYLDKLPTNYKPVSKDFDKDKIYCPMPGNFVFFGKIFPKDGQTDYRIDVLNISDLKIELHKQPFKVIISKLNRKLTGIVDDDGEQYVPFGDYKGGIGRNDPGKNPFKNPGQSLLMTANPNAEEEMVELDCSLQVARRIYKKCEEVFEKTNANTKGSARGNVNTTKPQSRGSGTGSGSSIFPKWTW